MVRDQPLCATKGGRVNRPGGDVLMVRVDGGPEIGAGHAMRCMALAQAWQRTGGCVVFLMAPGGDALKDSIQSMNIRVYPMNERPGSLADADAVAANAKREHVSWLVLDGYHFGVAYQERLKGKTDIPLLYIDDYGHLAKYITDLVLNQNISAQIALYPNKGSCTELLLGTEFVLLRKEFLALRDRERQLPERARNILITLGGSDVDNCTQNVIEALRLIQDEPFAVKVILGPLNQHAAQLHEACAAMPHTIELLHHVNNMAEVISWADLAISGAGSTYWEMALLRLPALLIILDTNQEKIALCLGEKGAACNLGWWNVLDPQTLTSALRETARDQELRKQMSELGHSLVDGLGADRVIKRMGVELCNA